VATPDGVDKSVSAPGLEARPVKEELYFARNADVAQQLHEFVANIVRVHAGQ
jgi:hypothetical protein